MQHARHRKEHSFNHYPSNTSLAHWSKATIWINDADLALVTAQLTPIPSHPRLSSSAKCSGVSMVCCSCFSDRHCDIQLAMEVKLLWLCTVVTSVVLYKANLHDNWCSYCLHLYTLSVCLTLTFLYSLSSQLTHPASQQTAACHASIRQQVMQAYHSRECKQTADDMCNEKPNQQLSICFAILRRQACLLLSMAFSTPLMTPFRTCTYLA